MLAMLGIPPTLGFIGRWRLYSAAYEVGFCPLTIFIVSSILALIAYTLALTRNWWGPPPESAAAICRARTVPDQGRDRRAGGHPAHRRNLAPRIANSDGGAAMKLWKKLMCTARRKSPWLFHMNSGSCNGCDIEIIAALSPRYDAEQLGVLLQGSPRHADILCVTGPVTNKAVNAVKTVYGQVCGPKAVVAIGSCPATTNVFIDSRTLDGPLDKHLPVDVLCSRLPAAARRHHRRRRQGGNASGRTQRQPGTSSGCPTLGDSRSLRIG